MSENTTTTETTEQWWIHIERESGPDLHVGPYPTQQMVNQAIDGALLIDGFCEEDALDCYPTTTPAKARDQQIIIDLNNPHHTG